MIESQPTNKPSAPPGKPLRQRIRDLPTPPEVAEAAKAYCKRLGFWGKKARLEMEEQMKLQHYYAGKWIKCMWTDEGPVVVAAAEDLSDPLFDEQLSFLTPEERRSAQLWCLPSLSDTESIV